MNSDAGTTLMDNSDGLEGETIAPPAATPRKPPRTPSNPRSTLPPNPLTSSDLIGGGRFTPGQILAERYRIVTLAARGGMGEVFLALVVGLVVQNMLVTFPMTFHWAVGTPLGPSRVWSLLWPSRSLLCTTPWRASLFLARGL
jgi:hypothetical protein